MLVLLFLSLGARTAQAQDQLNNFCRRFGHQTAVLDRKIYIDGGFINYQPLSQYPNNYTSMSSLSRAGHH